MNWELLAQIVILIIVSTVAIIAITNTYWDARRGR